MQDHCIQPIGIVHSCFKEKFAIPRQPALAPAATGEIELFAPYNDPVALEGLEEISHLWLSFIFHQTLASAHLPTNSKPQLRVRPPRLGGNKKVGVFATRSTHRPNALGLSVVKLDGIRNNRLQISGIDLLDGTPLVDIKPYLPYADNVGIAFNHLADQAPELIEVEFTPAALQAVLLHQTRIDQPIQALIEQMLAQDPKPAYQKLDLERVYGVKIWDLNVQWQYLPTGNIQVISVDLA